MGEERNETVVEVPAIDGGRNRGEEEEVTADSEKPSLRNRGFSFTSAYQMPTRHTKVVPFSSAFLFYFMFFVFLYLKNKSYVPIFMHLHDQWGIFFTN